MNKKLVLATVTVAIPLLLFAQKKTVPHKPIAKPAAKAAPSPAVNGKKVYTKYCLSCHQADGGGVMNMNPPLTRTQYVLGDKARIIKLVLNGFNQGVEIDGQTYTNAMPSFSYLKDKDVADVLTYVRSHFTNKATPIKTAEVTAQRTLSGSKK